MNPLVPLAVAVTIATEEFVIPHALPLHVTNDIEILDPPDGRLALIAETSGGSILGFIEGDKAN